MKLKGQKKRRRKNNSFLLYRFVSKIQNNLWKTNMYLRFLNVRYIPCVISYVFKKKKELRS